MNWWDVLWILFIVIPFLMFWAFALVDLFRRDDLSGWKKALWLVAIIFLPVLGTLFYVIFRPSTISWEHADYYEGAASWDRGQATGSASPAEQLSMLSTLHDKGKLSDQEFASEKSRILAGT